ncbi:hypothetical protein AXG93_2956s1180 [Marchantia polymorpha subsp. ruderalis]|uniref:Reverse transcriptase Ty1/copia-type domain-containing protein n=1 Tax=Marchantia polymorpha subsp. ruderalis TaxID=1480154 RepID=A0A176WAW3_MARPO|nr:hypothetical protein AXG93_2956s1180 [Marchantia polymorpha subsp. ruderalis]
MIDSKGVRTPLAAHFKLSAVQCSTDAVEKGNMLCVPYEQAVGSLMYLMVCTKPDIAFAMDKRRSTTGYVFTLGGGSISWRSTLQKCLAQSTTEAEYVAAAEAAKEAIWLDRLIMEMGLKQNGVNLHCDSHNALHLATNQVMDSRVKHIDIRYHFIRQAVYDKTIELVKIDDKLNPADALTKVIPLWSFKRHCATMQVVHGEHM